MKASFAFFCCLIAILSYGQVADSAALRQVDSLIGMSRQLTGAQQFDDALKTGEAAQQIALAAFGAESALYASVLFNQGRIFHISGHLEQAKPLYLEAKAIRERVLGKTHPVYARSLNNLALLYSDFGQYEAAEPLYLEAISILRSLSDKAPLDYAYNLNNLAILYSRMGRFDLAEPLFLETKAIREKVLSKEHPDYAGSLDNLAILYYNLGRYESAEPLYLEAKDIRGKILGKEHPDYAVSLNNLASLYLSMGRYESAEPLYLEAKDIREKFLGKEHPDYASSLNNLALLYTELGRYAAAESLFLEAGTIWGNIYGKDHPYYAECLTNLASLYRQMQRYESAESLFLEAKSIWEKVLGKEYPDYIRCLNGLAGLYREMNRYEAATQAYLESRALSKALLSKSARYLSGIELNAYARLFTRDIDRYYAFAEETKGKYADFTAGCYDNALFHKSFLLNVSSRISKLAASDTAATRLNNLLKSFRRRLAIEYAKPVAARKDVDELETAANTTEKELVRTVAGFGEAIREVNWQEVQAALKPGEAAIEFIRYRYYTPAPTDSIRYAALVLRPGSPGPQMVPLFEERRLERLLPKGNDMDRIDDFYLAKTGKAVYALIWAPLGPLLKGINTVYCAPSGLLHRINLGAIPVSAGRIIADRYRLVLLGSTRQLINQNTGTAPTSAEAVLLGGIRYDSDSTVALAFQDTMTRGSGPKSWKYLPATASEVNNIWMLLRKKGFNTQIRTGSTATEEFFKQLGRTEPAPHILHLATHGYFFSDQKDATAGSGIREREPVFKGSNDPMIRSGLILAGANAAWTSGQPPAQGEDGILTAYEISQQNLSNTEFVVLSACETGLGQIEGNEGVYGLQRAFKIAGVKYLIMSLWQVNDQKTSELMIEFYRGYLDRKLPVREAFWAARNAMRAKYPGSAYVWAGFVLVE